MDVSQGFIAIWSGSQENYFDASGMGLAGTPVDGWAICNGKNGTVNLVGMMILGTDLEDNHPQPLTPIGNPDNQITLTIDQMPSHNHSISDPGHTHSNDSNFPLRGTQLSSSGSGTPLYASNGSQVYTVAGCSTTGIEVTSAGGGNPISILPYVLPMLFLQYIGT